MPSKSSWFSRFGGVSQNETARRSRLSTVTQGRATAPRQSRAACRLAIEGLEGRAMLADYGPVAGSARDIGIGANGSVWVVGTNRVNASGYEIYRWTGLGWQGMPGEASRIAVDPSGNAWIVNEAGDIWRFNGSGWQGMPGKARDIGIGANGAVWVVGTNRVNANGYEVFRWNGSNWSVVPGQASRIAVDPSGNPWITNDSQGIWRWNGSSWQQLPGAAHDIAVSPDGTCWVVGVNAVPGGFGCWRWTGDGWAGTPSAATQISVGPSGHPWVVNESGTIFFGPGVAGPDVVLRPDQTNSAPILTNPGALSIPINPGVDVVNSGAITGIGTFITVTGGGTLNQGGMINAMAISIGVQGSASQGLGLSDTTQLLTVLNVADDTTITAPGGVVVEGILGLSPRSTVAANSPVTVTSTGQIRGSGTVAGALTVAGRLTPSADAAGVSKYGRLSVGQLDLRQGARVSLEIGGAAAGTQHDQLVVGDSVTIDGATLLVDASFAPPPGGSVVLVDNRGSSAVTGTFRNASGGVLSEGTDVVANLAGTGRAGRITYQGGDGNDVCLVLANEAPTEVVLAGASIGENASSGTLVGTLSAKDPDPDEAFTFQLVAGTGSSDNALFTIDGKSLKTKAVFDFESKTKASIRVKATDRGGRSTETVLSITVTNVNESPTGVALSKAEVAENLAAGTVVGTLSTSDPDAGNTFTYTFVAGTGADDNALFRIEGTSLKTAVAFNHEARSRYFVRVRSADQGGLSTARAFTIDVKDVEEPLAIDHVEAPAAGTYKAGEPLEYVVVLTRPVSVSGKPEIPLAIGARQRKVVYASGADTSRLVFSTVVAPTDNAPNGVVLGDRMSLPAGARIHLDGEALAPAIPAVDSEDVRVDTIAPAVGKVTGPEAGTSRAGSVLRFVAATTEPVTTTGLPTLAINVGASTREAVFAPAESGPSSLVFVYTVQAGDNDGDGIVVGSAISLSTGVAIRDVAGNALRTAIVPPATGRVLVDTVAPVVARAVAPLPGTRAAGQAIDFRVTFTEAIRVTGQPEIPVGIGAANRAAVFAGVVPGSLGRTLVFRAVPLAGDADADGVSAGGMIALGTGTMLDAAGNPASVTLPPIDASKVRVEAVLPGIASVSSPTLDAKGGTLTVRVTFSEPVRVNGTPTLPFTLGGALRTLRYVSGSLSATLIFRYVVKKGSDDMKLPLALGNAIVLGNATIKDLVGNAQATTALPGQSS